MSRYLGNRVLTFLHRITVIWLLMLILLNVTDNPDAVETAMGWFAKSVLFLIGLVAAGGVLAWIADQWDNDKGIDWLNPRNPKNPRNRS